MSTASNSTSKASSKKYWAFISYSSKDKKWGQWLHQRLENYPIPKDFHGTKLFDGAKLGKNLRPIFRDRDELSSSSDLGPAIIKALKESRYLIVLCSKNSAQSEWVNKEIEDFKSLGGEKYILALILDGEPNATSNQKISDSEECFPPALRYPIEPLAGDIRKDGDGKERGFIKILAGAAQLDFDELYQRHQRALKRRRIILGISSFALVAILSLLIHFAVQNSKEADQQREIVKQKSLEVDEQTKIALDNELRAKINLSLRDLQSADNFRWEREYPAAFAHLARSLRNNPGSVEASEIAWNLLAAEPPHLFSVGHIQLSKDRLASSFGKNSDELVWLQKNGEVCWIKTSDTRPYKTLTLPHWNEFGSYITMRDFKMSGEQLHIILEVNTSNSKWKHASYTIDTKTWEINPSLSEKWIPYQTKNIVTQGIYSAADAQEIGQALSSPHENQQVNKRRTLPLGEKNYFLRYIKNRKSDDDLFLKIPVSRPSRSSAHLWILESGDVVVVAGLPVSKSVVLPSLDMVLIQQETPKTDQPSVILLTMKNGAVKYTTLVEPGEFGRAGWAMNQSRSHILLYLEHRNILLSAEDLRQASSEISGSFSEENWRILESHASCSLADAENPTLIGYSEGDESLSLIASDRLSRYSAPVFKSQTILEVPVSPTTMVAPFTAIDIGKELSGWSYNLSEDVPVSPAFISDQENWAFYNSTFFARDETGSFEQDSQFPGQGQPLIWISAAHDWAAFGSKRTGYRNKNGKEGRGITLIKTLPPYEQKFFPFPKNATSRDLITIEDHEFVKIGLYEPGELGEYEYALVVPKSSPFDANTLTAEEASSSFSNYNGVDDSVMLSRPGFRTLRDRLEDLHLLKNEAPLFNPIGRGKKSVVFCQMSPVDVRAGKHPNRQIFTLSTDGQYIFGGAIAGELNFVSEDGSAAVAVDHWPTPIATFWCPSPKEESPPEWLADFLEDYSGCFLDKDGRLAKTPAKLRVRKPQPNKSIRDIPRTWSELRDLFESVK